MKIYVIGDSISIQYGTYLESQLKGIMEYSRKGGIEEASVNFDHKTGANGVMGVPTVVMLKGGEVKERFVGVQPKEVIKEKVSALI